MLRCCALFDEFHSHYETFLGQGFVILRSYCCQVPVVYKSMPITSVSFKIRIKPTVCGNTTVITRLHRHADKYGSPMNPTRMLRDGTFGAIENASLLGLLRINFFQDEKSLRSPSFGKVVNTSFGI